MQLQALSAPLLKKKGPVPKGFFTNLVVKDSGAAITTKLSDHGRVTTAKGAVTPVITCAAGKVKSSRLVVRGPVVNATAATPASANVI